MRHAHAPEAVIKTLGHAVRAGGLSAVVGQLSEAGDTTGAQMAKSLQSTPGIGRGASGFSAILPLVQRRSLIGQIDGIRPFFKVPPATRVLSAETEADAGFVLEGSEMSITNQDLQTTQIEPLTVRAMQLVTDEVARAGYEHLLSRALIHATARAESLAFASASAPTAGQPGGAFNGVTPVSGTSDIAADFDALVADFEGDITGAVMVCSPRSAIRLGKHFAGAGIQSDVCGIPIAAHSTVADDTLALIEPSRIMLTDDGMVVEPSSDATLKLDDDSFVSLFQMNLTALRIVRYINWRVATGAVALISGGTWS